MAEKKINRLLDKGVAKVPVIMQLEALECGAACLTMILAYFGKWLPPEQVREDCGVSRDGSNAVNIIKAAKNYGLNAWGFRFEPDELKKEGAFPCVIHWNFNHFVVLNGFKGNKVYINDPARGNCVVSMETFDEAFTGVCLVFEPGESFVPSGKQKSIWKFIRKRLSGLKIPIIFTVLTTIIASIMGIVIPVFDKIFYDRLLTGKNPEWFIPFIAALTCVYIIQVVVELISSVTNFRLDGKINSTGNLSYFWKVLHLPLRFFSQRMTGDIVTRQNGNAAISNTLVNTLAPLFLNSIMMMFYLVIMLKYSVILTIVGILTSIANMLLSKYISKKRLNYTRVMSRDSGKLYSVTVAGIQLIENIKASGAEDGFFEKWSGHYAAANAVSRKYEVENQIITVITSVISSAAGSLILGIGVFLTITGNFSLGSITAFQGFFTSFMAPVSQLIASGQTVQEMRTSMERIEDVMEYPDDPNIRNIEPEEGSILNKLSGNVHINNITFGYSPLAEPLIKDFSMNIKSGSRVAFVGKSGCGKSTISKLISGLYRPWSGEILFDGRRVDEIDHGIFTASLVSVDQEIILFKDTVANNIKMWDDSIEDFEMILAAKDAGVHYDIISRPGGYQHVIQEDGKDFSGGQRQRLEIARALAQEPNIIILDEATSALDAKTENEVVKAICDRGITCIIIAHRLSTIRDCDEIVALDKGKVVERGTHEELMSLKGYYANLITDE